MLIFLSFLIFADDDFEFEEKPYEISGSLKFFNSINHYFNKNLFLEKNKAYGSTTEVVNFKFKYFPIDILSFDSSYHIATAIEDNKLSAFRMANQPNVIYRLIDFNNSINNKNSNTRFVHNLNRFNLKLDYKKIELTLGRQAISKGSSKFINPIDIFSVVSFQNIDNEEKRGVDAFRIRYSFGDFTEVDFAYIFGKHSEFSESSIMFDIKTKISNTDLEFISIMFYNNYLFGFDISKDIKGILFYVESSYILVNPNLKKDIDDFIKFTFGFNYKFTFDLFLIFEYHYNSAGVLDSEDYLSVASNKFYKQSGGYLLGEHYLMFMFDYPINPIFNSSFKTMFNLTDFSFISSLHLDYNLQENIYIDLDLFFSVGKSLKGGLVKAEFSLYPNIYSLNIRAYF